MKLLPNRILRRDISIPRFFLLKQFSGFSFLGFTRLQPMKDEIPNAKSYKKHGDRPADARRSIISKGICNPVRRYEETNEKKNDSQTKQNELTQKHFSTSMYKLALATEIVSIISLIFSALAGSAGQLVLSIVLYSIFCIGMGAVGALYVFALIHEHGG